MNWVSLKISCQKSLSGETESLLHFIGYVGWTHTTFDVTKMTDSILMLFDQFSRYSSNAVIKFFIRLCANMYTHITNHDPDVERPAKVCREINCYKALTKGTKTNARRLALDIFFNADYIPLLQFTKIPFLP